MTITCEFKFSRTTPIYYSGEQIIGTITLNTTKQVNIEGLVLTLLGTTTVEWLEKSKKPWLAHNDAGETQQHILHSDKVTQLQQTLQLSATRLTLRPGNAHVQHFCFNLPAKELPPTCALEHGVVVYTLNLTLQRKYFFSKMFKARLVIKNRLDLSNAKEMAQPHTVCSKLIKQKSTALQCSIPCTGYVPGQQLPYELRGLDVAKALQCTNIHLYLWQRLIYRVSATKLAPEFQPNKVIHTLVAKKRLKVDGQTNIKCGQLHIPLVTPISTAKSSPTKLIEFSYYLEVLFCDRKIVQERVAIPITIGTVAPKRPVASFVGDAHKVGHKFCYDNLGTELQDYDEDNDGDEPNVTDDDEVPISPITASNTTEIKNPTQAIKTYSLSSLAWRHFNMLQQHIFQSNNPSAKVFPTLAIDRARLLPMEC